MRAREPGREFRPELSGGSGYSMSRNHGEHQVLAERELLLHVGTHKTGTTAIQAYMSQCRVELAAQVVGDRAAHARQQLAVCVQAVVAAQLRIEH